MGELDDELLGPNLRRSLAAAEPDHLAHRMAEIEATDDLLAGAARAIAEIDHAALFDHGVDLLIAGFAAQLPEAQ